MGKKNKRRVVRSAKPLREPLGGGDNDDTAAFRIALSACPHARLRSIYRENEQTLFGGPFVSDEEVSADPDAARKKMEHQLVQSFPLGRITNPRYRKNILQHIKSLGGVKITPVLGMGESRLSSFAYTCGFTDVAGFELILQNVHRSMLNADCLSIFNCLFRRHKDGHPVFPGSTVCTEAIAFIVTAPDNAWESTLMKATKTLEPTRLYGLTGYEILCLVPVGERCKDGKFVLSHEDVLQLKDGHEVNGFKPTSSKQMRVCAWCQISEAMLDKKLKACSACNCTFYCSKEHQKLHFKKHKVQCKFRSGELSKEEKLREAVACLEEKDQERFLSVAKGLAGVYGSQFKNDDTN